MIPPPDSAQLISRREAIKRASLFLGLAISPSLVAAVIQSPITASKNSLPRYLSQEQFGAAGMIAERIIPRTDTPGALDVGVPGFMDLMYGEFMTEPEKVMFSEGLEKIEAASLSAFGLGFQRLSPEQQDSVLTRFADASKAEVSSFFGQIREVTVVGYFTSEQVGKNVLHYDPVPGRYDADVPISEVGNSSWTT